MPVKMQLLGVLISAEAGNLDIEQLDQRGSVKLHLIKRVTAVRSYCWVLLCIAEKQPGCTKREAGDGSVKQHCARLSKQHPHQDPTLSFLLWPRCCQGIKGEKRRLLLQWKCGTDVLSCFLIPQKLLGDFKDLKMGTPESLGRGGAVPVCPRQPLQCHTWEFPVLSVSPLCSQQGMGLATAPAPRQHH